MPAGFSAHLMTSTTIALVRMSSFSEQNTGGKVFVFCTVRCTNADLRISYCGNNRVIPTEVNVEITFLFYFYATNFRLYELFFFIQF